MEPSLRSRPRYAVAFQVAGVAPAAGALVVEEERLLLEGRSPEGRVELSVPYAELTEVRIARSAEERLHGRPTLLLARENGPLVQLEPLGLALLHELGDLLAALVAEHASDAQAAVIVPLKRGSLRRAKELVAAGPPFDPGALHLTRHEVFLNPDEAVFVFAGPHVRETLERVMRDPSFWRLGLAWRGCIAGRPRLTTVSEALTRTDQQLAFRWTANDRP